MRKSLHLFLLLILLLFISYNFVSAQSCTTCAGVTSFNVDLTSGPDAVWTSPVASRSGNCCTGSNCIRFIINAHPLSDELSFAIVSGPSPGGMSYQVDCGPLVSAGTPLCVTGSGPYCVVYCKPGGDKGEYRITATRKIRSSPDITLRNGCIGKLYATGLNSSTVSWNSVFPGAKGSYNNYLNCTSGCDTTIVTPQVGYPPYIDFEVVGSPLSACSSSVARDTIRVSFVGEMIVGITPTNPKVCFGQSNATITANVTGGAAPFIYKWSNGATTQSISVPAGAYSLEVSDATAGCGPISASATVASESQVLANAGPDVISCANNLSVKLNGSVTGAEGGTWTGGAGVFSPDANTLNATYTPSSLEITSGGVVLRLSTTGSGGCPGATDEMKVTIVGSPIVNAGPDQTVCSNKSNVSLVGAVTGSTTTGIWNSNGSGTFSPNNTSLTATYIPSSTDLSNGAVTLTLTSTNNGSCLPVSDNLLVSFTSSPTANAGIDQSVCANNAKTTLNGMVTIASGGVWATSGSGAFSPNNTTLNATYTPSAADIAAGGVTLTLTTTGNGNCNAVSDAMILKITPAPIVNAGVDQKVCANNSNVTLTGAVTGTTTTGAWSTNGSGTFSPNNTTLNATYTSTQADITSGSIRFILSSTNNGSCLSVTDSMVVQYTPAPTADAGADQTLCANNANVLLNGNITVATGGAWTSSGSGTFSPNNTTLNAAYTPSTSDITSGAITLTLTNTGNGNCTAVSDIMGVQFTPSPTAGAGADQTVCANNAAATLNGSITIATGGIWSTTGSGTFSPNGNTLNATYTPSASDISSASVALILTTTGNGNCNAVSDTMILKITPAPIVNAGVDQKVCANNANFSLAGSVAGASSTGIWSTTGSGTFSPNNITLNATYTSTQADITSGSIRFILSSTNNGSCLAVTDSMVVQYTPSPTADAGADQTVCANNAKTTLSGKVTVATGGIWATSGSGVFSPNNTTLNAAYTPSASDKSAGKVTLRLTTTGNGNCTAVSDLMDIFITPAPVTNAGPDQTICKNNSNVSLSGKVTGGATTGQWTSSGTGSFSPSNTTLTAIYIPSSADLSVNSVSLTLTSTNNGNCLATGDLMVVNFTNAPVVNAGSDQTICSNNADVSLSGSVSGSSTTGKWSTSGSGTFSPNDSTLNAVYISSSNDITSGKVSLMLTGTNHGNCNPVKDTMNVNYSPAPTANAGNDITVCANNSLITLNGAVTIASGGTWSTSGTGLFSDISSINSNYTPSATDTANGSVYIILTTTGNGNCKAVSDSILATITPAPYVLAGEDKKVCLGEPITNLSGISSTGSGIWATNGTGTFSSNTSLNTSYTPSQDDISKGEINFSLTSSNNGNCNEVSDTMKVQFTDVPVVSAGADQTVCANNAEVTLNGSVSGGASEGQWSTSGTGAFTPSDMALNAKYIPSAGDTATGKVTIVLQSTNGCIVESDSLDITITPAPYVAAGPDQIVCESSMKVTLNGLIAGGASKGIWNTSGDGDFTPSADSLNVTYLPGKIDMFTRKLSITLTSIDNANCIAVTDTLLVSIISPPTAIAGSDQVVCANNKLNLSGTINGGSGTGAWSTPNGTGAFANANDLIANYSFSSADTVNKSLTMVLTSTNNGNCPVSSDSLNVTITPAPIVNAGLDLSVCANNNAVSLSGTVTVTGKGIWSALGAGAFSPNASSLSTTYNPDATDIANGMVTIVLTSTDNGNCIAVTDTLIATITPSPLVNAGIDQFICEGTSQVSIKGNVSGGAVEGIWSASGTGSFSPDNTSLTSTYNLSTDDANNKKVFLILNSTNNGNCLSVKDSLLVTITTIPNVYAGSDTSICSNNSTTFLEGKIVGGSGKGVWSTIDGKGNFTNATSSFINSYVPSDSDITKGSVKLILQSIESCQNFSDTLIATFTPAPEVNAGSDQSLCPNDTLRLNGNVSIASGGKWTHNGSGNLLPNDSALNASYIPSDNDFKQTTLTFILISTGNGNCLTVSDTMLVRIGELPVAKFTSSPSCVGSATTFTNGSTVSKGQIAKYDWDFGNGVNSSSSDTIVTFNSIDQYTVQLITTTDLGCKDTTSKVVYTNPLPAAYFTFISATVNDTVYFYDQSTIFSGEIVSRLWDLGDSTASSLTNPSHLYGTPERFAVKLLVRSDSGCNVVALDTVILKPVPVAHFTLAGACSGNTISFTDSSHYEEGPIVSWKWDFGDGNISLDENPSYTFADNGPYKVMLTVTAFDNAKDTTSIMVYPGAILKAGYDYVVDCSKNNISFKDTSYSSHDAITSWRWNFEDGPSSTEESPVHVFKKGGYYNVLLKVSTTQGCKDSVSYNVYTGSYPEAKFTYNIAPSQDTVSFVGSSLGKIASWSWNFGDSSTSSIQNPANVYKGYGKYIVSLSVLSDSGCAGSFMDTVNIAPYFQPYIRATGGCTDNTIAFSDSTVRNINIISWKWDLGDGTISNLQNPIHTYNNTGIYSVRLIVTAEDGSSDSTLAEVNVNTNNLPIVHFDYDKICLNNTIAFKDSSDGNGMAIEKWLWTFGDDSASTLKEPNHSYEKAGGYLVKLTVSNSQGCTNTKDSLVVTTFYPRAMADTLHSILSPGKPIEFINKSEQAEKYLWNFGDKNGTSKDKDPIYTYAAPGDYLITLVAESKDGCMDTTSFILKVNSGQIAIPTAFSPNGDNQNDILYVRGGPLSTMDFRIFNEWGNEIFRATQQKDGWDGNYLGKAQPVGAYIYTLTGTSMEGKTIKVSGEINLVR